MILEYINLIIPSRDLWQIADPQKLVIVVSKSAETPTEIYLRPGTGIGQVVALAYAVESLRTAYGILDIKNVHLSTDALQELLQNDLLLLGSPKTNEITDKFLNLIGDVQPARQTKEGDIYWGRMVDGHRLIEGEEWFPKEGEEEQMTKPVKKTDYRKIDHDYGLIMRARNPFSSLKKRTVVLFSGKHTYGTMAAAIYFTKCMNGNSNHKKLKKKENFVALVEADVRGNFTPNPKLVRAEVAVHKIGPKDNLATMEDKFYAW
jgi:hypothetical protein